MTMFVNFKRVLEPYDKQTQELIKSFTFRPSKEGDACCDLCSAESHFLQPMSKHLFPTGIAVELPTSTVGLLFSRSGLAYNQQLILLNGVGVIDSGYRGEIKVALFNLSNTPIQINAGDRIAQFTIFQIGPVIYREAQKLSDTERGDTGFGSTGKDILIPINSKSLTEIGGLNQ